MNDCLDVTLKGLGVIFILLVVWLVLAVLKDWLCETIDQLKWEYKHKHRFDKPPTAKCYCKDCKYYRVNDVSGNYCTRGHIGKQWRIADSWFCWQAEPHERDPENNKQNNIG